MKEKHYNTNLIILGDLIAGPDGCLEATDDITLMHKEGQTKEEYLAMLISALGDAPTMTLSGDYDLTGENVKIKGSLYVYGNINYDPNTWTGHISAGTKEKED